LPRAWDDYQVTIQKDNLPKGITLEERLLLPSFPYDVIDGE
jgi:hypothetical protein